MLCFSTLFWYTILHVSDRLAVHYQESAVPVKTDTADSHSPECVIPDGVLIQFGPPDDEHLLLETSRGIK
jgi:hypothetical protein